MTSPNHLTEERAKEIAQDAAESAAEKVFVKAMAGLGINVNDAQAMREWHADMQYVRIRRQAEGKVAQHLVQSSAWAFILAILGALGWAASQWIKVKG